MLKPGISNAEADAAEPVSRAVVTLDETALPAGVLQLRAAVASAVRVGERRLVVDISRLDRLSSSTLSALLWAQQRCRAYGGAVVLRGISQRNRRMLSNTGLWRVFATDTPAPDPRSNPRTGGDRL